MAVKGSAVNGWTHQTPAFAASTIRCPGARARDPAFHAGGALRSPAAAGGTAVKLIAGAGAGDSPQSGETDQEQDGGPGDKHGSEHVGSNGVGERVCSWPPVQGVRPGIAPTDILGDRTLDSTTGACQQRPRAAAVVRGLCR